MNIKKLNEEIEQLVEKEYKFLNGEQEENPYTIQEFYSECKVGIKAIDQELQELQNEQMLDKESLDKVSANIGNIKTNLEMLIDACNRFTEEM